MLILPDFRPHFNFDESRCAYIGDERYGIRTMVDFIPNYDGMFTIVLINNDGIIVKWEV